LFIVGWGHSNHAFVKHALQERYIPRYSLVPRTPLSTPLARLESPHREARHSMFGCVHGGGSDVSSPDTGMQQAAFGWSPKLPERLRATCPLCFKIFPITHIFVLRKLSINNLCTCLYLICYDINAKNYLESHFGNFINSSEKIFNRFKKLYLYL